MAQVIGEVSYCAAGEGQGEARGHLASAGIKLCRKDVKRVRTAYFRSCSVLQMFNNYCLAAAGQSLYWVPTQNGVAPKASIMARAFQQGGIPLLSVYGCTKPFERHAGSRDFAGCDWYFHDGG
jgi:hypothetical protein